MKIRLSALVILLLSPTDTGRAQYYENTINGFPAIIVVKKTTDQLPLGFEEIQDRIMNDYQEYPDQEWNRQLKEIYTVKIDSTILNKVKGKLQNE